MVAQTTACIGLISYCRGQIQIFDANGSKPLPANATGRLRDELDSHLS